MAFRRGEGGGVGFLFLLFQLFVWFSISGFGVEENLLWLCNNILLFFSIGFVVGDMQMVKGLICVGLIGQIGWALDFLLLAGGVSLFGITEYVFSLDSLLLVGTLVAHFGSVFVALYLTFGVETRRVSLVYACLYGFVLFVGTLLFASGGYNINCVFAPCGFGWVDGVWYVVLWPVLAFVVLILPGYGIQVWLDG